jgi:spermidine dehydrogenase
MTDNARRPADLALGIDQPITRRDFLGSTLLASGAQLLEPFAPAHFLAAHPEQSLPGAAEDWNGYGGVGDYANSNGNTWEVLSAGHRLRGTPNAPDLSSSHDTGEVYDSVIVGGGISGLAAALVFLRQAAANARVLILENHPIFGGEAKQNEFEVDGRRLTAHQGSAIYFVQYPRSFLAEFYDSIGLRQPRLQYQTWGGPGAAMSIGRTPYDAEGMSSGQYGFWFGKSFGDSGGKWVVDAVRQKFARAPVTEAERGELLRWYSGDAHRHSRFVPPQYEGDDVSRALDAVSLEDHYMQRFGLKREFIRTYLSPDLGGGSGLGADALSAYSEYAADLLHPYEKEGEAVQMFPGGNTTIARLLAKALIPASIAGELTVEDVTRHSVNFAALDAPESRARLRQNATALAVSHQGDPQRAEALEIVYSQNGQLFRVRARSAVMAGGSWTTKHIVRDLSPAHQAAYAQFFRSPCVMANVALRNWHFLAKLGVTGCRWLGGAVGSYFEVCRKALVGDVPATISPDQPMVVTLKILFSRPGLSTEEQGHRGRAQLITTSFREYERQIREQFAEMFSAFGFDPKRDIAGLILNRWGHAYLSPQPGFFFGSNGKPAPREVLRAAPFGRIAFANTDLAGAMDHRYSILEARRAVLQLFDSVIS